MSALTDRIAAEHGALFNSWNTCLCGAKLATTSKWNRHIAEVTEAAVREQVARDIEAFIDGGCDCLNTCSCGASDAYRLAARIARGGAA